MTSRRFHPTYTVLLVAGTFFMENLDGTVIVTALPQMAKAFHVDAINLNVGMTAYLLALAIFIPISGWVADRMGARTVFLSAISLFTFASLICGITHTLPAFLAARVLQGVGGAMMVPVGRLVVLRNTEKSDLVRALAYVAWPGLLAPVLGPPIGGFITSYLNWRWIFYLNLPLGIIALLLARLLIDNDKEHETRSFDWKTFLCFGGACTAFLYALEACGVDHPDYARAGLSLALSAVLAWLALRFSRTSSSPLIDLESFKIKTYASSMSGGSAARVAISVAPFLLPLMFESAFHMTEFQAGSYLLALFAGNFMLKFFTTRLLRHFRFKAILVGNGLLVGVTSLLFCVLTPTTPKLIILGILFISGLTRSMQFTAVYTLAFADVPKQRLSAANSFFSAMVQLSMSMGIAVGALAMHAATFLHGRSNETATLADFHLAFLFTASLSLFAVVDALFLAPNAGDHLLETTLAR